MRHWRFHYAVGSASVTGFELHYFLFHVNGNKDHRDIYKDKIKANNGVYSRKLFYETAVF